MSTGWTGPDDIAAKVRRRWVDGSLLSAYARLEPFPVFDLVIRGPKASQLGDDLTAVQDWVRSLDSGQRGGSRYTLEQTQVGGRHFGRNQLPSRARIASYEQAWALLGVAQEVRVYDEIQKIIIDDAVVSDWVADHPHQALAIGSAWPRVLAAYAWLEANRGSGRYVREISAPGVDTKFAEQHRAVLSALLGVSASASGFSADLGLRSKPQLVRLRVSPGLGLPEPLTELAVRPGELAQLALSPTRALVVENEVTYLSVDIPDGGVVLWGKGFEVNLVGRLPWLIDVPLSYWGDLDTHGFAILDRLRAFLPQTVSILMDRETLMTHRDRWGVEDRPATSRLTRLAPAEAELYEDLVGGHFGERIRLEQERIDWAYVLGHIRAR